MSLFKNSSFPQNIRKMSEWGVVRNYNASEVVLATLLLKFSQVLSGLTCKCGRAAVQAQ
jgi:hypothetical protein